MGKSYVKIGREAGKNYLENTKRPVALYSFSSIVDNAVRDAGKKDDLFGSLFDYEDLVPSGWHCTWLQNTRGGDRMYYVVPNGFRETPSNDLLLGSGTLVAVSGPD